MAEAERRIKSRIGNAENNVGISRGRSAKISPALNLALWTDIPSMTESGREK